MFSCPVSYPLEIWNFEWGEGGVSLWCLAPCEWNFAFRSYGHANISHVVYKYSWSRLTLNNGCEGHRVKNHFRIKFATKEYSTRWLLNSLLLLRRPKLLISIFTNVWILYRKIRTFSLSNTFSQGRSDELFFRVGEIKYCHPPLTHTYKQTHNVIISLLTTYEQL